MDVIVVVAVDVNVVVWLVVTEEIGKVTAVEIVVVELGEEVATS